MKRSIFVLIAAAIIAYGILKLIRTIGAIVRYMRIQRKINRAMNFMSTDEYRKSVEEQAAKVMEDLGL